MQPLLQHFFGKDTLEEIPVETIRGFAVQHPSFVAGQYFLTKKLYQLNDSSAYREQFQKTLAYFTNPFWLQYQLHHASAAAAITVSEPPAESKPAVEVTIITGSGQAAPEEKAAVRDEEHVPVVKGFETKYPYVVNMPVAASVEQAAGSAPVAAIPGVISKQDSTGTATPFTKPAPPSGASPDINTREQTIQQESPFVFQSYHTIDYFASQGIKLNQEVPDDKLGRQLKSFTEWLKVMRRLPQPVAAGDIPPDEDIASFTDHSLEEKEVLTEAMAEVLIKQGKFEKAREVYRKLSLLNPHKSAYFAAKSTF